MLRKATTLLGRASLRPDGAATFQIFRNRREIHVLTRSMSAEAGATPPAPYDLVAQLLQLDVQPAQRQVLETAAKQMLQMHAQILAANKSAEVAVAKAENKAAAAEAEKKAAVAEAEKRAALAEAEKTAVEVKKEVVKQNYSSLMGKYLKATGRLSMRGALGARSIFVQVAFALASSVSMFVSVQICYLLH